jgi:hypothetical protein
MTEVLLSVGEPKIRQFERKKPLAAVAELVWNALDANAKIVRVTLHRSMMDGLERIEVWDDGDGITPAQANESFREYGDSWKSGKRHTARDLRILHGKNGEGRLYALALGESFTWDSVAEVEGKHLRTIVTGSRAHPTRWNISDPQEVSTPTGTIVSISVPQGKRLRALEADEAADNLTAKLAFYLLAYRDVQVIYGESVLDPERIIHSQQDLELDLPPQYPNDTQNRPFVTFIEWRKPTSERKMLICNAEGIALAEHGEDWHDSVVSFTPYLRWRGFNGATTEAIHMLPMQHAELLYAADQAIKKHLGMRRAEISSEVIERLKDEGLYPYTDANETPTHAVKRQTFDLVVTVARSALPARGIQRALSVNLIQAALEHDPTDLHAILDKVLSLSPQERQHLAALLDDTKLASVIAAASTVVDRLTFVAGLRKILANKVLRAELREVDQLHPMVAKNLWLFGEEWHLARTEVGLTSVLEEHLELLGDDVALEGKLEPIAQGDGRSGRVDVLLYRNIGDERSNDRLIVELKRPSVVVGKKELDQIKGYARAIVDNPQYRGTKTRWQFVLVTYNYKDNEIGRDIRQRDKPFGLADDHDEYQVWVKTWGEIFDSAERKLHFFKKQLDFEATDERVTQHLRETYRKYLPASLLESTETQNGDASTHVIDASDSDITAGQADEHEAEDSLTTGSTDRVEG